MVALLAAWAVLAGAGWLIGLAILHATRAAVVDRPGDRAVLAVWLGLLLLGNLLLAVALIFPIDTATGLAVVVASSTIAASSRSVRAEVVSVVRSAPPSLRAALLVFAAGIAFLAAQPVVWTDTGLYHAGIARWLNEFGAVEGTGLVHFRLGFASSWLALAAPVNPSETHAIAVLGGLALALFAFHLILCARRAIRGQARVTDWFLLAAAGLLLPTIVGQRIEVSANPDIPIAIVTVLIGWAMLCLSRSRDARAEGRQPAVNPSFVALILGAGAVTVKLQAAPVALVALLYYASSGGRLGFSADFARRLAIGAVVATGFFVPWIAHETIATGCPAFPAPVCLDVPWSVGTDVADEATDGIRDWARTRLDDAPPSQGALEWTGEWITRGLSPIALVLLGLSLLLLGLAAGVKRVAPGARNPQTAIVAIAALLVAVVALSAQELLMAALVPLSLIAAARRPPGEGWLLGLGLVGLAVLFAAAPDPRFALGYMGVLLRRFAVVQAPRLGAAITSPRFAGARLLPASLAVLLVAAAVVAVPVRLLRPTTTPRDTIAKIGLVRPPASVPADVEIQTQNGITYRVPADGLCWSTEPPCTPPGMIRADTVLQDPEGGIGSGFQVAGR